MSAAQIIAKQMRDTWRRQTRQGIGELLGKLLILALVLAIFASVVAKAQQPVAASPPMRTTMFETDVPKRGEIMVIELDGGYFATVTNLGEGAIQVRVGGENHDDKRR